MSFSVPARESHPGIAPLTPSEEVVAESYPIRAVISADVIVLLSVVYRNNLRGKYCLQGHKVTSEMHSFPAAETKGNVLFFILFQ